MAHHMNLAMQTLFHVPIIKCIVQSLYFNPFTHFLVIIQDFALYLFISPSLFMPLSFFCLIYFYTSIPFGGTLQQQLHYRHGLFVAMFAIIVVVLLMCLEQQKQVRYLMLNFF
jgi:hypothetical protein